MVSIKDKLNSLHGKKSKLVENIVFVMKEMGWSWEQMIETPISTFIIVTEVLSEEAKRYKKGKK